MGFLRKDDEIMLFYSAAKLTNDADEHFWILRCSLAASPSKTLALSTISVS